MTQRVRFGRGIAGTKRTNQAGCTELFMRAVSKDVLELMVLELAQHELLRVIIFQRVISVKNCGGVAIFDHWQNAACTCYTDTLTILKKRETFGISVFFHEETYCDSGLDFIKLFYDCQATDLLRSLFIKHLYPTYSWKWGKCICKKEQPLCIHTVRKQCEFIGTTYWVVLDSASSSLTQKWLKKF